MISSTLQPSGANVSHAADQSAILHEPSLSFDAGDEAPLTAEEVSVFAADLQPADNNTNNADGSFVSTISINQISASEGSFSRNTTKTVALLRKKFDAERKAGQEEQVQFSKIAQGVRDGLLEELLFVTAIIFFG